MVADIPAVARLFAIYVSDLGAAAIGVAWIVGRILYMMGYTASAAKRGPGFAVQSLACGVLLLGSLGAILWRLVQG
jgi:glutathione S-transferase